MIGVPRLQERGQGGVEAWEVGAEEREVSGEIEEGKEVEEPRLEAVCIGYLVREVPRVRLEYLLQVGAAGREGGVADYGVGVVEGSCEEVPLSGGHKSQLVRDVSTSGEELSCL